MAARKKTTKKGAASAAPSTTPAAGKKVENKAPVVAKVLSKEEKRNAKAKRLFASYPSAKELFFTDDELAFFNSTDAKNHANTLQVKEVLTINR